LFQIVDFMKSIQYLTIALLFTTLQSLFAQDAAPADPRFAALLKAYDAEISSFVDAKQKAAIATLDEQLDQALGREEQAAIQAGTLNSVTAIRSAREELKAGTFLESKVEAGAADGAIDRLAKLYAEERAKLDAIRAESIKPRRESLRKQLAELEIVLTREAKIEEAVAVKNYRLALPGEEPKSIRPGENGAWGEATTKAPYENFLGMKFVPVPIVGEKKERDVYFAIWETRVSDFEEFVKDGGQAGDDWQDVQFEDNPQKGDHPVLNISKSEAEAFCKWLRKRDPGVPYRLPTDHEWSCAAEIGDQEDPEATPASKKNLLPAFDWRSFPINKRGVQDDDEWPFTAPVDSLQANAFGLYHVLGNAWEIVDSAYGDDPEVYTARGLAWNNFGGYLRKSQRLEPGASWKKDTVGFRVVIGE